VSAPTRPRVLVVDDSAFARKVLREVLSGSGRVEVVGTARDGLDALEQIESLRPDAVTLDLVMPNLDGVGVLQALDSAIRSRTVVVSVSDADSERGAEALALGAFDLVHKPTTLASNILYELGDELVGKVLAAVAAASSDRREAEAPVDVRPSRPGDVGRPQVLVVGTSTGGPQALTRLLTAFPRDFPLPIVAALHIPSGYTDALARRIDRGSLIHVCEAADELALRPGLAVIARGGLHLRLERRGGDVVARLSVEPVRALHRPSVDELFSSAAEVYGPGVLAAVLTGMGTDGLEGARRVRAAGGTVLAESPVSAVVYGMPRAVWEAGIAAEQHPLDRMATALIRRLG
jgi:two-component system chemotaxis response regulator CheB